MAQKIKAKYLLFFLSIFQCLNLNSMEKEIEQEDPIVDEEKLARTIANARAAVARSQVTIARIPSLLQNVKNKKIQREQDQINHTINQFKSENTVLLKMGRYFAFYKRDIVRGSCFALDSFAEYLLYKKLFEQKVDYVLEMIKEDSVNLENLMEQVDLAQTAHDQRNSIAKFVINRFKTLPEITALKKYINNKHKMVCYNPFKMNLLPCLILSLVKTKVLHYAENLFLTRLDGKCAITNETLEAYQSAYEKDNLGNLNQLNSTPFSMASLLMFILNPRYMMERMNFSSGECLAVLNKFCGLNLPANVFSGLKRLSSDSSGNGWRVLNNILGLKIPNILFSDLAKVLASVASLGLAVKFTDSILNSSWSTYVVKNQAKFLKLLEQYNSMDKINVKEVEKIERELRKFISDGHSQGIFSGWEIKKQNSAKMRVKFLLSLPVIGALAWKCANFYKAS